MIDVPAKLTETNQAIAFLQQSNLNVPAEAFELKEIMERCVAAENRVRELQGATRPVTHPLAEDQPLIDLIG